MFWRYGFVGASPIDGLLDKDDCTLDKLLDEDELLQEVKSSHTKLISYLTEPERMRTLVEYCVVPAAEGADEKRKFKYPYVASEVLSAGETCINDSMMKDGNLARLLNFMGSSQVDPLLAGYFNKVMVALVESNPTDVLAGMEAQENFLASMVTHLHNGSIADLLIRLTGIDELTRGHNITLHLCNSHLVMLLVNALETAEDEEVHSNAAEVLMSIAHRHSDFIDGNPTNLYEQLTSAEVVDKLLQCVLTKSDSLLVHGLQILMMVLEKQANFADDQSVTMDTLPPVYNRVLSRLDQFVARLQQGPGYSVTMTYGELKPPCGHIRVRVVEFLAVVVKGGYRCIEDELIRLNVLPACLDLFFKYPWNNFLSLAIDELVRSVLGGGCDRVKSNLFSEYNLAQRFVQLVKANEGKLAGRRDGSVAFVVQMSNCILNTASGNVDLRTMLDGVSEWKEFVEKELKELNAKNNMEIGGPRPNKMKEDDDDDDQFNRDEFETELNNTAQRLAQMKDLDDWREKTFDMDEFDEGDVEGQGGDEFSFEADFESNMSMNVNPMFDPRATMDSMAAAENQFAVDRKIENVFESQDTAGLSDQEFVFQPSDEDFARAMEASGAFGGEVMNIRDGNELGVGDDSNSTSNQFPAWEADFPADNQAPAASYDDDL